MKNTSMVSQILELLIKSDTSLLKKDGSINQAAAAKAFGIHQPTLFRILSGKSAEPKSNAVQGICGYFGIQPAQLRGEAPLEIAKSLTENPVKGQPPRLTKAEELLLSLYRSLSPVSQKIAIRVVAALRG
jgi:transcriptional regulator with XRE-family HTH domain